MITVDDQETELSRMINQLAGLDARGLFGTDAGLTFTAETDATHLLVIADGYCGPGGYVMTISR
ncbi:MAG: hypothetical protein MUQ27_11780 [Acidimicrobiia bacterium]|nr:hypothetical protein [Acidimicrobiia bacterium]